MNAIKVYLIGLLVVIYVHAWAQTTDEIPQIIQQIENLPDEIDISGLLDIKVEAINICKADFTMLVASGLFNPTQAQEIVAYRIEHGNFISIYELQVLESISASQLETIAPYISLSELGLRAKLKEIRVKGKQSMVLRTQTTLQKQAGYHSENPASYAGNRFKQYLNYRFSDGNFAWGLTSEKDAGEQYINSKTKEIEYLSAYLHLKSLPKNTSLIFGNFTTQFGQGLAVFNGLGFGKSPNTTLTSKFSTGLQPYKSANEGNYFRGVGLSTGLLKHVHLTCYFSSRYRDAGYKLLADSLQSLADFSAIDLSGFHRTNTEINRTSTLKENTLGGNIETQLLKRLSLGFNYIHIHQTASISPTLLLDSSNLGNSKINSVYFTAPYRNFFCFGELAYSNQSIAALLGFNIVLHPNVTLALLGRNIHSEYTSPLAASFTENTKVSNEKGVYIGLEWSLTRRLILNLYTDQFYFPTATYLASYASRGIDQFQQLQFVPNKKARFGIRHRWLWKQKDGHTIPIEQLIDYTTREIRIDAQYYISENISFSNRIQFKTYSIDHSIHHGEMFFQDLNIKFPTIRLTLDARYTLFDIKDYNARIYAFENDVPGNFSIQMFNQEGYKWYLLIRKSILKHLDFWVRFSQLRYENLQTIGSAGEQIIGNTRNDLKIQLRYSF